MVEPDLSPSVILVRIGTAAMKSVLMLILDAGYPMTSFSYLEIT